MSLKGSHILLFRLEVHSMAGLPLANNLVVINKESSYTAVVECLVYDCESNDLISIHDSSDGAVGSHHWVVDSIMVGNDGAEQGFDFASPGTASSSYTDAAYDVKFINNRIQCTALPGLSRLTGTMGGGVTAGKISEYVWILDNTITGKHAERGIKSIKANLAY